jgi:hypothetical protein
MEWELEDGRYTCVLPSGVVAHAARTERGWEILVPSAGIHELVKNGELRTWLSARTVVERVIRARLEGADPFD